MAGIAALGLTAAGGGTAAFLAVRTEPTVLPNVTVAGVDVGGMTRAEVEKTVQAWWQAVADKPVAVHGAGLTRDPEGLTARSLGGRPDPAATAASLPTEQYWPRTFRQWRGEKPVAKRVFPVIRIDQQAVKELVAKVEKLRPAIGPARASFENGEVRRIYEQTKLKLDASAAADVIRVALSEGTQVDLPLVADAKHVPDEALDKVKTVIGEFTTHFDAGNISRSSNIKLAAKMLSGRVFMPGEAFGFNETLGKRTKEAGFKEAGVYVSGKHDIDVGGGICQVSTTLYNTVLQAGLKVASRSPHSLPVPYVPLGQDAAVSFPQPDFKFVNTRNEPVALVSEYQPGKLTFKILGASREPGDVKIVNKLVRSWSRGIKYIHDPSLPPGKEIVREKGGEAREVVSWRLVTVDGQVVKREPLGSSTYTGGPRVVEANVRSH